MPSPEEQRPTDHGSHAEQLKDWDQFDLADLILDTRGTDSNTVRHERSARWVDDGTYRSANIAVREVFDDDEPYLAYTLTAYIDIESKQQVTYVFNNASPDVVKKDSKGGKFKETAGGEFVSELRSILLGGILADDTGYEKRSDEREMFNTLAVKGLTRTAKGDYKRLNRNALAKRKRS